MEIPRAWAKVSGEGRFPDGKAVSVSVWGWGEDIATAKRGGASRLERVLDRIRRGAPFPERYGYASRPLREEILEALGGASGTDPSAVVTRNSYGAQVLNAARLLFLDIDLRPPTFAERIKRVFGGPSIEHKLLGTLRDALRSYGRATFRLYRTASGFRAMAIDREFDPTAHDVQDLMRATGTDPAYARLCAAQRSFRARLTPKPWRCSSALPPGHHPRLEIESQQRFAAWLSEYEELSSRYATCRYLETVGSGSPKGSARELLERHDRITRCNEQLPLA